MILYFIILNIWNRCFGDDGIITHFIGFQIDLIDQPDAILRKSPSILFYTMLFILNDVCRWYIFCELSKSRKNRS